MEAHEVKERLKELGFSIRGLSRALGVNRRLLKQVMYGRVLHPALRAALGKILGVSQSKLPSPEKHKPSQKLNTAQLQRQQGGEFKKSKRR